MSVIPKPILGLDADPTATARERQLLVPSRIALSLSLLGAVMALIAFGLFALIGVHAGNRGGMDYTFTPYAAPPALLSLLLTPSGFGLGIYARRTRNGKAAMAIALLLATFALAFV